MWKEMEGQVITYICTFGARETHDTRLPELPVGLGVQGDHLHQGLPEREDTILLFMDRRPPLSHYSAQAQGRSPARQTACRID